MKTLLYSALFFVTGYVVAQQESHFASTFNNPYVYNPAAGGLANVAQVDLITRFQWVGAGGGPKTILLSGHSVLGVGNSATMDKYDTKGKFMQALPTVSTGTLKHVVGGKIMSDEIGVFNKVAAYGSYAIHLPVVKDFNLGVGIGLGWSNYRINANRVVLHDSNDDTYLSALTNTTQQHFFDANVGLVFYGKGLMFGASANQVFGNKARFKGKNVDVSTQSSYVRNYILNLAYGIKFGKSVLEPGVIAHFTTGAPSKFDFGARFIYNNATWLGVYGRTSSNIVFQFGTTLVENLYLSYAYELSVGRISNAATGSHEVQLGIFLGKRTPKAKVSADVDKGSKKSKSQ
ncbi:MAG TPA: PorP/SprF family type IX secretion system membrane protein [Taishania sp.]|nr:PorP/SprF family type IX secretion system membrane protein [Taishania sp.]